MAHIIFYTKSGCTTSARQVELLRQSSHEVEVRDLLAHPWQPEELLAYFDDLPVAFWFNPNSPRVKSGEIDPLAYGPTAALTLMQADHLLIRRPLMAAGGKRLCGFDPATVHEWVGLKTSDFGEDLTSCSQPAADPQQCP
jgi:nitrogenase-associated protein